MSRLDGPLTREGVGVLGCVDAFSTAFLSLRWLMMVPKIFRAFCLDLKSCFSWTKSLKPHMRTFKRSRTSCFKHRALLQPLHLTFHCSDV